MIKRILPAILFGVALVAASQANAQSYNGSSDRRLAAEEDNILDTPGEVAGGVVNGVGGVFNGFGLSDGDGEARCARRFHSFNAETGTYTTYAGQTVRCPYLD